MPTGLYDIRDREPVLHPDEIEAGRVLCEQQGLQYIDGPDGRAIPLAAYIGRLTKRWQRAVQTAQQMRALQAGYCTIEAKGAPAPSQATH
jgi:hypothetical protein